MDVGWTLTSKPQARRSRPVTSHVDLLDRPLVTQDRLSRSFVVEARRFFDAAATESPSTLIVEARSSPWRERARTLPNGLTVQADGDGQSPSDKLSSIARDPPGARDRETTSRLPARQPCRFRLAVVPASPA